MATKKRLIDANEAYEAVIDLSGQADTKSAYAAFWKAGKEIQKLPTVDSVEVPCKIGDFVWAIRNFKGKKHPQRGIVSDMYFLKDMSLQIVVKYVARGKWGETVFATDKDAYAAIGERRTDGR